MISYREQVLNSWVQDAPSVRGLAGLLTVPSLVTVRGVLARLHTVESVTVDHVIATDGGAPLGGHVTITLRSDGSYVFAGFMRATGAFSYHFAVQAWVNVAEGTVLAAQESGRVFGTDTPGHRQRDWSEPGSNRGLVLHWRSLRQGRSIGYRMHADISGLLGGARDALVFIVEGIVLVYTLGGTGWVVLIGSELANLDAQLASPDILEGIAIGSATLLILGPYGIIPAIVAGVVTVALSDVRHRAMRPEERAFADRVFNGMIDYNDVVLTNLSHDNGRKFTIPSIGGSILVNLNDAFDAPLQYGGPAGSEYAQPAAVFIHELTHAWQIHNNSFLGVVCGMDSNYDYFDSRGRIGDTAWPKRRWSTFNNEQQAHIVDDWYGAHVVTDPMGNYLFDAKGLPVTDLDGFAATNDPAFHFIRDNIRIGVV